ncbi:mucin-2-like [Uranotaenia lowii]|uniref:mucin-2-like n=1 Tax=Uranotaenia lowii TaxID=190385 RepID=UPI002478ED99|nr:mucin-2-like [Uranotaenia lowii]
METEENNRLPYLDMIVTRKPNQKLTTEWYKKNIASGRMLSYDSCHQLKHKINVARNFIHRVTFMSRNPTEQNPIQVIHEILQMNNYPKTLINRFINLQQQKNITAPPQTYVQPIVPPTEPPTHTVLNIMETSAIDPPSANPPPAEPPPAEPPTTDPSPTAPPTRRENHPSQSTTKQQILQTDRLNSSQPNRITEPPSTDQNTANMIEEIPADQLITTSLHQNVPSNNPEQSPTNPAKSTPNNPEDSMPSIPKPTRYFSIPFIPNLTEKLGKMLKPDYPSIVIASKQINSMANLYLQQNERSHRQRGSIQTHILHTLSRL